MQASARSCENTLSAPEIRKGRDHNFLRSEQQSIGCAALLCACDSKKPVLRIARRSMMGSESHPLDPARLYASSDAMDSLEENFADYNGSSSSIHPLTPSSKLEEGTQEDYEICTKDEDDCTASHEFLEQASSSNAEFLHIRVSQPQKEVDNVGSLIPGGNTFVTYLITTRTNIPSYGGRNFSIRRRFKDIVTLADRLGVTYRGYFIPSRPDKSIVESQIMGKHDFIEQRRVGIERYLRRLASHPVLRKSEELRLFLLHQGKLPLVPALDVASRMLDGAAKLPRQLFGDTVGLITPQDVTHSAKGGRDLLRLFKELKQSVTNDWGSSKPLVVEEDKEFLEKKEKLREFERQLTYTTQQADAVTKAQHGISDVMGTLGLSFVKLGKLESQYAAKAHAAEVKRIATVMVKTSRFHRVASERSTRHFGQFHEHLATLQSAHAAFSDRSNALLTVQTLLSEIEMMHSRSEKLSSDSSKVFGGDKNRIKKIEDLKDAIKVTERSCECAQEEYNSIKEHNRIESERIENSKQSEIVEMLKGYISSQVEFAEKSAKEWNRFADECKRVDSPLLRPNLSFKSQQQ